MPFASGIGNPWISISSRTAVGQGTWPTHCRLPREPRLQPNAWTLLVQSGPTADEVVKVSFFGTIGFGRYGEPDWTDDEVLRVASLDDLMACKTKVICSASKPRTTWTLLPCYVLG